MGTVADSGREKRLQRVRDHLRSSWTYLDVLALALAISDSTYFRVDPLAWTQLVADWKDKAPKLLGDVYFDARDLTTLYSNQVESFFQVMTRSGALTLVPGKNGSAPRELYHMEQDTKDRIISRRTARLIDDVPQGKTAITTMAEEIDQRLGYAYPATSTASSKAISDSAGHD